MKSSLKNMVVVLFSVTAIAALLVALVNELTLDTIKATESHNKDVAKLEVLPAFEGEAQYEELSHSINDGSLTINVTKVSNGADGSLVGYAVEAPSITKNGYADRIYLMVGFVETQEGTLINGVKVLSQKETPGLGANMTKEGNALELSVIGCDPSTMTFKVKKDDASGSFDSLTGSTVSSRAYANAIETAYAAYLWAKSELPMSSDAQSGATKSGEESYDNSEAIDAESGATLTDESNYEQELEAQKGEISNE